MSRPPFKPTAAMKQTVAVAAGGGMSHEEIAIGLGISRPTLEKHFAFELSHGAYAKRLEVLQAMQRAAKKGNVAAQKAYMQLTPAVAVPTREEGESKPPKLGKKDQAQEDAVNAGKGTEWGDILPKHGATLQ
jgi:hypothetical protein